MIVHNTCRRIQPVILTVALAILTCAAGRVSADTGGGNPLSMDDMLMLLRMHAPSAQIQKMVERRGVDFVPDARNTARLREQGVDASLLGLIALNQRAAPTVSSDPPAEYLRDPNVKGVIAAVPASLPASERGSCDLELKLDQTVEVTLQGRFLLYDVVSGGKPSELRGACTGPLPASDTSITVQKTKGRGLVLVQQRPAPQNGFLARVRIEDPASGEETYQIRIDWTRH